MRNSAAACIIEALTAWRRVRLPNSRPRLQLGESLPGLGSINSVYASMGWTRSSVGRWMPPGQGQSGLCVALKIHLNSEGVLTGDGDAAESMPAAPQFDPQASCLLCGSMVPEAHPRMSHVTDMWRTSSLSDFRPKSVGLKKRALVGLAVARVLVRGSDSEAALVRLRCGAPPRRSFGSELNYTPKAPYC